MNLNECEPGNDVSCAFIGSVVCEQPRSAALIMLVLEDRIEHQDNHSANIIEHVTSDHFDSTVEVYISRAKTMGPCEVIPCLYLLVVSRSRQVFMTPEAAELLKLEAAPC